MSVPEFDPVNELEKVLVRASSDASARPDFYRKLYESDLWLLTPDAPVQEGRVTLKESTNVSFVNLNGPQGSFMPIFTSQQRLQETVNQLGVTYEFVALKGKDLFPIFAQHPPVAILNPGAAYGKELTPEEVRRLGDGTIFKSEQRAVQKATDILLGQPADYPHALVAALHQLFQKHPTVVAAYVAQMHDPSSGDPPHLLIGIECDGDYRRVVEEAGVTSHGLLGDGKFADFIQVGGGTGSLDDYFKKQTKPFYQRGDKRAWWKVW